MKLAKVAQDFISATNFSPKELRISSLEMYN